MPGASTGLVALLGDPVAHSISPAMQNAAFRTAGLDLVYLAFRVPAEELGAAVAGLRALGAVGANVTVPHKVAVLQWLDELSPEARLLGAVNTVVREKGRLVGHNTDAYGFRRALEEGLGRLPRTAVIAGAGGAARAAALELARAGAARLTVVNRTPERGQALVEEVRRHFPGCRAEALPLGVEMAEALRGAELLVNATSVGMWPHSEEPPLLDPDWLPPGLVVCDLVYNPRETALIRAARARGLPTVTGEQMLLYQGARAFELWTGQPAPVEEMRRALLEALAAWPGARERG
ncbi:MAG: shikimate dehydrogenase [Bacillota bacterium]|nr:shikimate dehydrogenase [Bacillota bacterium]